MNDSCTIVLVALYETDSFSVRTLHAVLARNGFRVRSVFLKRLHANNTMDAVTERETDLLVEQVRGLHPMLVGLSVRSVLFRLAAEITGRIRKEMGCPVVWGGIHPTIRPQDCIRVADMVCVGEGEDALLELAQRLSRGEPLHDIRNLWVRQGERIVRNPLRPLIHDLDSLPFPDFTDEDKVLIEGDAVRDLDAPAVRTHYPIMTSRGCPYRCAYCCNSVLRNVYRGCGPYLRRRSAEHVMDELGEARRLFPRLSLVCFWDDLFAFDLPWLRRFQPLYGAQVGLPFFCFCHPGSTTDEMVSLLKAAGGRLMMTMGIQAGSERIRRGFFHRLDTNEEIVRASQILARNGVACSYDILMDNPLEEESDRRATLDLLLRLPRPFELHTHTLTHFPETDLTRLLLERKLIQADDVEDVCQKSYTRWSPSLDLGRDRENLFWDNLYYLASSGWVPGRFILWMSRRRFLKRCPHVLTRVLKLCSDYVQTVGYQSRFDRKRFQAVTRVRAAVARWRTRVGLLSGARVRIEGGRGKGPHGA